MKRVKRCFSWVMVIVFAFYTLVMPGGAKVMGADTGEDSSPKLSLMVFNKTNTMVELVWTSKNNSVNAVSYDVYRDNVLIQSTDSFVCSDTELIPETVYTYMVKAKDAEENIIAFSNEISVVTSGEEKDSLSIPEAVTENPQETEIDNAENSQQTPEVNKGTSTEGMKTTNEQEELEQNPNENTEESLLENSDLDESDINESESLDVVISGLHQKAYDTKALEVKTDRFIIKYKDEQGSENFRRAVEVLSETNKSNDASSTSKLNKSKDTSSTSKSNKLNDTSSTSKSKDSNTDTKKANIDTIENNQVASYDFSPEDNTKNKKRGLNIKSITNGSLKKVSVNNDDSTDQYQEASGTLIDNKIENLNNTSENKSKNDSEDKSKNNSENKGKNKSGSKSEISTTSQNEPKQKPFDIVTINEEISLQALIDEINIEQIGGDIEYIQPDYELELSSNDPYYSSQWGIENISDNSNGSSSDYMQFPQNSISLIEEIHMMVPHISDMLEEYPEAMEFFISTPIEELLLRIEAMDIPESIPEEIALELMHDPMLRDVIRDYEYRLHMGSETLQVQQYLYDVDVTTAWDISTGNGAVVGIIDTGIDITHEDLADNIWVNYGEIPYNGIDDDGNGYIDDINGWSFTNNSNIVYNQASPSDDNHGTAIAGIIAAKKDNGIGIAGVAPSVKVVPLKVFTGGKAYTSDIIRAIEYASTIGIKVLNCSWGSTENNPALEEAINQNTDILFICAAGNNGMNIDELPIYPASYDLDNIISVASVNKSGQLSVFSNYGVDSVDIAAPGEEIISTTPQNQYNTSSGTSMATAFVSGEVALLVGKGTGISVTELKNEIIRTGIRLSALEGKVYNAKSISCGNALYGVENNELIENGSPNDGSGNINQMQPSGEDSMSLMSTVVQGLHDIVAVAGGNRHTLALRNDGTVWAWGRNDCGQLGDGTTTYIRTTPVQVTGLRGVTMIASGYVHSIALKNDGTVCAWGRNGDGQLGDGTTTNRRTPVQVTGLSGVTMIAGGYTHSIALKNDGTVWAWGYNYYGQLGDGTTTQRTTPVQVTGLSGVTMIAGGNYHSLALKNDGTVWAWGRNDYGQLGDGTNTNRTTPVQVTGLSEVTMIVGGSSHSIALKNDGTVWAWGRNDCGQLGNGTTTNRTTPVQVTGLSGVTMIASGDSYSIALKNDGTVWAWGYNNYGQLGDGTTTYIRTTPVQVTGLSGVTMIAGGDYHSLALKNDGTVWAWGYNYYGQLGDGATTKRATPIQVTGLSGVTMIAGGSSNSIALKNDGTVWAWGGNYYGQLLDGTTTNRTTPVQVTGLSGVTMIAGGNYHSLALKNDGTVWAWGRNDCGQLGDGTYTNRTTPVQVTGLSGVTMIAEGEAHSIALKNDGTVWAWGCNHYGQLGDGITTYIRTTPVQVTGLSGVTMIASGYMHSIALKNDGTVWAWGYNNCGQLGNGTTTNRTTPVQVTGLSGVTMIASGYMHSIALKNNGTVWVWGYNNYGQLGDGTVTQRTTPVQVTGLSGVTAIARGGCHTIALKNNGTVCGWGRNGDGQLGDGTVTQRTTPVQVTGLSGVTMIAGGDYHSLALKNNGTVWTWGNNNFGQLGDGMRVFYSTAPLGIYGTAPSVDSSFAGGTLLISYSPIGGTLYYEIEIDGQIINNGRETTYTQSGFNMGENHTIRVRSVNYDGYGLWSELVNIIPPTTTNINCNVSNGYSYNVILSANNIENISNKKIILEYDSSDFELVDLCAMTKEKELTVGSIEDMNITITECISGRITFTVNKILPTDSEWGGILNCIVLKALRDTSTEIIYNVY